MPLESPRSSEKRYSSDAFETLLRGDKRRKTKTTNPAPALSTPPSASEPAAGRTKESGDDEVQVVSSDRGAGSGGRKGLPLEKEVVSSRSKLL